MLGRGFGAAVLVVIADQLSKAWILSLFADRATAVLPLTGFFNLVRVGNYGMSFGLFNNEGTPGAIIFTVIALVIVVGLVAWLRRSEEPLLAIAIGLVIGGAIGNVIDRLARGAVVDFLDFHVGLWHWPAFNIADSAICVGVGLMIIDSLLGRREAPN